MTKILWFFPDEMKIGLMKQEKKIAENLCDHKRDQVEQNYLCDRKTD